MIKFFLIFLTSFTFFSTESRSAATDAEYIRHRNFFVKQFTNNNPEIQKDQAALAKIEKMLQEIIGPVKFSVRKGEINLITLDHSFGGSMEFDRLDGLNFKSDKEIFFVTTKPILNDYLSTHPNLPKDFIFLAQTEEFYSKVFGADATFFKYAELPLRTPNSYAFLALTAQDMEIFLPNNLIILSEKNGKIYVAITALKNAVTQITICENEWNRAIGRQEDKEISFRNYRKCFADNMAKEKFFLPLVTSAQTIADRI